LAGSRMLLHCRHHDDNIAITGKQKLRFLLLNSLSGRCCPEAAHTVVLDNRSPKPAAAQQRDAAHPQVRPTAPRLEPAHFQGTCLPTR
jgi:hypothetical protein